MRKKLVSGDLCVGDTVYITSDKYLRLKSLFGTIKRYPIIKV